MQLGARRAGFSLYTAACFFIKGSEVFIYRQHCEEVKPVPPLQPGSRARSTKLGLPKEARAAEGSPSSSLRRAREPELWSMLAAPSPARSGRAAFGLPQPRESGGKRPR